MCVGLGFAMDVTGRAVRELSGLPEPLQSGALAGAVLALAGRLDDDPSDREAAMLARELRLALADLRAQAGAEPEEVLSVGDAAMGT